MSLIMKTLNKAEALKLIRGILEQRVQLPRAGDKGRNLVDWDAWINGIPQKLEWIFGPEGSQVRKIASLLETVREQEWAEYRFLTSADIILPLEELCTEIEFTWPEEGRGTTTESATSNSSKKVFIVHGHDEGKKNTIARFILERGLTPIILDEQEGAGIAILQKLERHADVGFVIVLLTPDDVGAAVTEKDRLKPRARQNVIFELGYFVGRRARTVALNYGVEIPSDYSGIAYIDIDGKKPWQLELIRELRAAGYEITI